MFYSALPEKKELCFRHLYGDTWAVINRPRNKWDSPGIILPKGFQPEEGKNYQCIVRRTKTGVFVYEKVEHHLSIAWLQDGNPFDFIDYEFHGKKKEPVGLTAMALAFQKVNIRDTLPEKWEMVDLYVQPDRKNGGYQFRPQYKEADEAAAGKPSMRFFKPLNKNFEFVRFRDYRGRVEKTVNTGRTNVKNAAIVEVFVTIV